MKSKELKTGRTIIVKLQKGEEVLAKLIEACDKHKIKSGVVSGIGAVSSVSLIGGKSTEKIDANELEYKGPIEIAAAVGNVAQKEGKTYIHLHGSLGLTDHKTISGHIVRAVISLVGEFAIIETLGSDGKSEGALKRGYEESLKMWTLDL